MSDERAKLSIVKPDGETKEVPHEEFPGDAAYEAVLLAVKRAAEKDDADTALKFAQAAKALWEPMPV